MLFFIFMLHETTKVFFFLLGLAIYIGGKESVTQKVCMSLGGFCIHINTDSTF